MLIRVRRYLISLAATDPVSGVVSHLRKKDTMLVLVIFPEQSQPVVDMGL